MRYRDLSPARQILVRTMQDVNFGQFFHLLVLNGEPQWNAPPRVRREIRLSGGSQNGPCPERNLEDFTLKDEQVMLFEALDRMEDTVITELRVQHGLPFQLVVEETLSLPPDLSA
jgi:hypothetical protein